MLYRIEYRYFYYDREFTYGICHMKLSTYIKFEKEPDIKTLVKYFNENLVNKDKDLFRNKLYISKIAEDSNKIYSETLETPASITIEKVVKENKCYCVSGAGVRFVTSPEIIKEDLPEDEKLYGYYKKVKDDPEYQKMSKKKQEHLLETLAESHRKSEESAYSEYNLSELGCTLNTKETDEFLRGF